MREHDGGPAFPAEAMIRVVNEDVAREHNLSMDQQYSTAKCEGMSLRDYFAAKAMQSLILDRGTLSPHVPLSSRAYEIADAMLEGRRRDG